MNSTGGNDSHRSEQRSSCRPGGDGQTRTPSSNIRTRYWPLTHTTKHLFLELHLHKIVAKRQFRLLNLALRARWPWMERAMDDKPWREFNIQVPPESLALFHAATKVKLGDGTRALFWEDWWLEEGRIPDVAPNLIKFVNKRAIKAHTVQEGCGGGWWEDVHPYMSAAALREFLLLGDRMAHTILEEDSEDKMVWTWERDSLFSSKSAYAALFPGRTVWPSARVIWQSRAPLTCKVFGWLSA